MICLQYLAGDNQDDPNDLYRAIDRLIDNKLDYVQGSRWLKEGKKREYDSIKNNINFIILLMF